MSLNAYFNLGVEQYRKCLSLVKRTRRMLRAGFLLTSFALLTACATNPSGWRWQRAHTGAHIVPQASELTVDQERLVDGLCPAGMPQHNADYDAGPTEFIVRHGYALEFSNDLKIPLWVCEHVTAGQLTGHLPRPDDFRPDPFLHGPRSELKDYRHSGYDRGHQAPAADQTKDEDLKEDTFYLSNIAPQIPEFNQQTWAGLEDLVRSWTTKYGEVWVITGGMLYDPAEENPATADGWIKYSVIGQDGVAVPTHFYKIVARREGSHWDAIGFVLKNQKYNALSDFSQFVIPIRVIEERTGIDFLPEEDGNGDLENRVPRLWP